MLKIYVFSYYVELICFGVQIKEQSIEINPDQNLVRFFLKENLIAATCLNVFDGGS